MKTKSLALAAVIATAMSAPTMAADWFVGAGVGAQQNTYKLDYNNVVDAESGSLRDTENNEFYEFRVGTYLNDSSRVYGTYSYNSDDASRQQSLMVSYDYLVGLGASNKLNWFIGATAGVNHISPDFEDESSKDRFVWGGQTGLMYQISDKFSTELGYRYLKQDYKVTDSDVNGSESIKLQDSQQLYLAVDYRF